MRILAGSIALVLALTSSEGWAQSRIYTLRSGTPERTAIMDAARLATGTTEQFIVNHLAVMESQIDAVAIAEIEVASRSTEIGGVFLFRRLNGRWQAVAMVAGGGGSTDCTVAAPIVDLFITEARRFSAPMSALPATLFRVQAEAKRGGESCSVAKIFVDGRPAGVQTENSPAASVLHFVDGTRPPDAWLSLRSVPGGGYELQKLFNGTLLQVIERRPDNWWLVKAIETGTSGWVLSRNAMRSWVQCCKSVAP